MSFVNPKTKKTELKSTSFLKENLTKVDQKGQKKNSSRPTVVRVEKNASQALTKEKERLKVAKEATSLISKTLQKH